VALAFGFTARLFVVGFLSASVFLGAAFLEDCFLAVFFGGFVNAVLFRFVGFLRVFLVAIGEVYHWELSAH